MSVHRNGTARRSRRLSAGIDGWRIDGIVLLVAGLVGMQQRTRDCAAVRGEAGPHFVQIEAGRKAGACAMPNPGGRYTLPGPGFHRLELASFLAHPSTSCFDAVAT